MKKLGGSSRARRVGVALLGVAALAVALVIPATSFADNASGCDFAPTGSTPSCSPPLSGSKFEGGDGNLVPSTAGNTDWSNVAGRNTGIDLPSGTTDNAFGQGSKEDDPNVSVVTGSIPPNKSDLTRFYEASEFANSSNFLYLGWERTNVLGSANFDFEINQATQPDLTTTGPKTLNRTAGDLLVTFDFTNGGGKPTLGLLRWVTTGSTSQCFSSNSLPCWGNQETLNSSDSIGAVNNLDAVTDPIAPNAPRSLPALTFGETAINLTAAGVFPPGTCQAFGSAFVKSRSSASFTAEAKDFVAPVPVNISNCGEVKIIKHTDPRGVNQAFNYTSTIPNPTGTVTPNSTPFCQGDTSPSSFTLNDSGNTTSDNAANSEDCKNVPANSYTVTEGSDPPNFTLESLTCTAQGTGSSGSQDGTNSHQADITVAPNGLVTCTYVNQQHLGAIKITKTGKNLRLGSGQQPLAGATFTVKDPNGNPITGSPFTTGATGVICADHLPFGAYSVQETAPPPGYGIDNTIAVTATVSQNSTCGDSKEAAAPFTDTPLTNLTARAAAQAAGATNSTIQCVNSASPPANIGNSPQGPTDPAQVTANGLKPGTYTCTINIDP